MNTVVCCRNIHLRGPADEGCGLEADIRGGCVPHGLPAQEGQDVHGADQGPV